MFVSILFAFDQVKHHLRSYNMSMLSFVLQFVIMAESNIYRKGNFVHTLSNMEEGMPAMCFASPNTMLLNPIFETHFKPM